jgi:hypothetical protein
MWRNIKIIRNFNHQNVYIATKLFFSFFFQKNSESFHFFLENEDRESFCIFYSVCMNDVLDVWGGVCGSMKACKIVCLSVCKFVCKYVCVYVCLCVCLCVCV